MEVPYWFSRNNTIKNDRKYRIHSNFFYKNCRRVLKAFSISDINDIGLKESIQFLVDFQVQPVHAYKIPFLNIQV